MNRDISRLARLWPLPAGALLSALYLAFPEKVYVFDGIMFAAIIERLADDWRSALFNPRHLVFNPVLMFVRDALAWAGLPTAAYPLVQKFNAVLGVLGIGLYYRLVARLTGDRALSALAAAGLALSAGYWGRAVEGQVYMSMTVGAIASALGAAALVQDRTARAAAFLAAAVVTASLFHTINVVLLPMALAAVWLSARKGAKPWWSLPAMLLGIVVPFAAAFDLRGRASLYAFLLRATDSAGGARSISGVFGWFFGAPREFAARALYDLGALYTSLAAGRSDGAAARAAGAAFCLGLAAAAVFCWRRKKLREAAALLLLWWSSYVFVNTFWPGGPFFWSPPLAALLAAAALPAADFLARFPDRRRALLGCGFAAAAALGAWNLGAAILPQSRIENNEAYRRSLFVRDHTIPEGVVLLSGLSLSNLKSYIPYFAQRRRDVLEYYFNGNSREEGLRLLRGLLQRSIENGIPVYLLTDLVNDPAVQKRIEQAWGVTGRDLDFCIGPGHLRLVAAQDPQFGVYLFVPAGRVDRLLAVLTFRALIETDPGQFATTLALMKALAEQEMTPEQLRQAAANLKAYDYGAALVIEGILKYVAPQFFPQAQRDIKNFDASQSTAGFHARLGEIYLNLGLVDHARQAWRLAYQLGKDPAVAARLATLGK